MDVITMSSVVQHGLIQRDRIFSLSVLLPDKPGELVHVASVIAKREWKCHPTGSQSVCKHEPQCSRRAEDHTGSIWNGSQRVHRQCP